MKPPFGQALVAAFRQVLLVFLQTVQNTAVARLHCRAEPFHVFDAGKLIPFGFSPAYQPLPDDLLASRIQLFHALEDATSASFC